MEHKTVPFFSTKIDEVQGIVEHIFAVMGNIDEGFDVLHPGSFRKTLSERGGKVRVLDQHKTDSIMRAIGKPLEAKEIGRESLPPDLLARFPDATGGVWAKTQFLMDTPEGKGAFIRIKEGAVDEWSFGYDAVVKDFSKATKDGQEITVRNLREVKLYEYSPVLWGMNQATMTTAAKSDDGPSEEKPYGVVHEDNGKWCVYKLGEDGKPMGKPLGTHDTEEEARAQQRALYANEGKDLDFDGLVLETYRRVNQLRERAYKETWSAASVNDLPDSCFLYIEPGGKKVDGKTEPRSLRHLPYKDSSGKVDLPHLRNAISRLSQSGTGEGWLSDALRTRLLARARRMLANAGGGKEWTQDDMKEIVALLIEQLPNDDAPSDANTSEAGPSTQTPTKEIDAVAMLKQIELAELEISMMEV